MKDKNQTSITLVLLFVSICSFCYATDMNADFLTKNPITEMSLDQLNAVSLLIEESDASERDKLLGLLWMNLAYSKAIELDKPALSSQDKLKATVLTVMKDKRASFETRLAAASVLVLGWKYNEKSDAEAVKALYEEVENKKSPEGLRMKEAIEVLISSGSGQNQ